MKPLLKTPVVLYFVNSVQKANSALVEIDTLAVNTQKGRRFLSFTRQRSPSGTWPNHAVIPNRI